MWKTSVFDTRNVSTLHVDFIFSTQLNNGTNHWACCDLLGRMGEKIHDTQWRWVSTSIQWNQPWGNSWSSHFFQPSPKSIQEWCQHVQFHVNIQSPYYMVTWCDMAIPLLDGPSVAGIACSKTLGPKFPQFQARSLALTVKPHSISSPTDQAVPDLGLMRMAEKFGYFYPF